MITTLFGGKVLRKRPNEILHFNVAEMKNQWEADKFTALVKREKNRYRKDAKIEKLTRLAEKVTKTELI